MILLLILSALISLLSCICLACSQKKHAAGIFSHSDRPHPGVCQRWGWGLLLLSLLLFCLGERPDFVIILWPMFFGLNGLVVALVLAFRPGWLRAVRKLPGLES